MPPSALIYHFGIKEKLFHETLRYHFLEKSRFAEFFECFKSASADDPMSISMAVYNTTAHVMRACCGNTNEASVLRGLLVCMFVEGGPKAAEIVKGMREDFMLCAYEKLRAFKADMSDTDLFWWTQNFWGRVFFPMYGEKFFQDVLRKGKYAPDFVESLIYRTTRCSCLSIGLPMPDIPDPWRVKFGGENMPGKQ